MRRGFPLSHREPADFAGVAVSVSFRHREAMFFYRRGGLLPLQSLRGSVMPKQSHSVSVTASKAWRSRHQKRRLPRSLQSLARTRKDMSPRGDVFYRRGGLLFGRGSFHPFQNMEIAIKDCAMTRCPNVSELIHLRGAYCTPFCVCAYRLWPVVDCDCLCSYIPVNNHTKGF